MRRLALHLCCFLALVSVAVVSVATVPAQSPTVPDGKASGPGAGEPAVVPTAKPKAGGAKAGNSKAGNSKAGGAKVLPGITPEREAAVMTFVKQHHPELAELLIHLKENSAKEYDRAVRDLLRTSERLAQVQERDSLAYELDLKLWKAHSRAQLLAARLQMTDSEELQKQLRATLNEEYDMRLQLLRRDHERATERMKNLGEQLDRLGQRRDEEIEKQLKQLTSSARSGDGKAKSAAKKKPPK